MPALNLIKNEKTTLFILLISIAYYHSKDSYAIYVYSMPAMFYSIRFFVHWIILGLRSISDNKVFDI